MNDLSPEAQRLVRAGRNALRPSDADRERIFEALRARLGDAAMIGEGAGATSLASGLWPTISVVTVGLAIIGGALFYALRPAPRSGIASPFTPPAVLNVPSSAPPPSVVSEQTVGPASVRPRVAPPELPSAATPRSSDRLAQEVALLSRATGNLHAGRADEALKVLDEHQRKFPNGVLAEERRAARAQALCALGHREQAEVELARLAKTSPQSPQAARARQLCNLRR